jgi:hypothetical protein
MALRPSCANVWLADVPSLNAEKPRSPGLFRRKMPESKLSKAERLHDARADIIKTFIAIR